MPATGPALCRTVSAVPAELLGRDPDLADRRKARGGAGTARDVMDRDRAAELSTAPLPESDVDPRSLTRPFPHERTKRLGWLVERLRQYVERHPGQEHHRARAHREMLDARRR